MTDLNAGRLSESFTDYLRAVRPDLLPTFDTVQGLVPHGTTILALRYADGVCVAGDRRATSGYAIASRDIEKVFATDSHSAIAISGATGPSLEMVRLFQTELEFYEKVNGNSLTLEGRANYLGQLIRSNFTAALQGLVVLPLFAGFDTRAGRGRLFSFDITGGRYEEADFHAQGSGGVHARNTLKKSMRSPGDVGRDAAIRLSLEALADAAEEDTATAGPDPVHAIYPTVFTITAEGVLKVDEAETSRVAQEILADRSDVPRSAQGKLPQAGSI